MRMLISLDDLLLFLFDFVGRASTALTLGAYDSGV